MMGVTAVVDLGGADATLARLPAGLRPSIERHQKNLAGLIASLRSAGMPPVVIADAVRQIVGSYETELFAAITELARESVYA